MDAAFPGQVTASGGARVAVHLSQLHPTEQIKCRFGLSVTLGVSNTGNPYVGCVAPSLTPGFMAVHAARNGDDFEYLSPSQVIVVMIDFKVTMELSLIQPKVCYRIFLDFLSITCVHLMLE